MVLPSRRLAAMTAGLALVASFFVTSLARLNTTWEVVGRFSPLTYYQSGEAIHGLNFGWFAGLLAAAGLFAVLAWRRSSAATSASSAKAPGAGRAGGGRAPPDSRRPVRRRPQQYESMTAFFSP